MIKQDLEESCVKDSIFTDWKGSFSVVSQEILPGGGSVCLELALEETKN